jgi:hypothetical protein
MDIIITDSDTGTDDDRAENEQQVSDNVLMIEISGPEVHTLSIIDFPGFMRSMFPSPPSSKLLNTI